MSGSLTTRQRAFVQALGRLGDARVAALEAGYAPSAVTRAVRRLMSSPAVREAIHGAVRPDSVKDVDAMGPASTKDAEAVSPAMIIAGLRREADFHGQGTTPASRLKALELLARITGCLDRGGKTSDSGEAVRVVFDLGTQAEPVGESSGKRNPSGDER